MAISKSAYANRRTLQFDYYSTTKKTASLLQISRCTACRNALAAAPTARDDAGACMRVIRSSAAVRLPHNAKKCR
jgi:hypothetical protein